MTRSSTDAGAGHRHDRRCYWDHRECGWVCGPRPAAEPVRQQPGEAVEPAAPADRPLAATR